MRPRPLPLLCALALLMLAAPVPAQSPVEPDTRGIPTIAPVIERITGAVVSISAESEPEQAAELSPLFRDFFGLPEGFPEGLPRRPRISLGSGVIVDAGEGYVLTNHHVIAGATAIRVTLKDRRDLDAELIGSDPGTDIAVLRVAADDLSDLPLGTSDALRVGDYVAAVGNPFGIGQTVTLGIVSALGRAGINPQGYEDFIQTDASINPGNSGGALATLDGRLVGINTAIVSHSGGNIGIGFAVPIDMARAIMEQIVEHGEVRRGQLGVRIQNLTEDLALALGAPAEGGAVVVEVVPDSAAEAAGLSPGDVVTAVDGVPVLDGRDLRNAIGTMRPDREVTLTVQRGDETLGVTATLRGDEARAGDTPVPVPPGTVPPALAGAVLEPLGPGHPGYGEVEGVAVAAVEPGSEAAAAGLLAGDVVIRVNRDPVASMAELEARMSAATETVALTIWRAGREILVVLERDA